MISVVVLGFLFGSSTSTNAQITNLKLSTDPITYTEISGGTNLVAGGSAIGAASSVTPIGFDFVFQGNTYSNFSVNAAGLLKLGTVAVTTESANNASSTTNTPKLYAWWDATATVAAANGGGVTFALSGSAPNRVLTVQWRVAYTTNASAGFSYQVKLYETTNVIEYLYGAIPPSGTLSASVGLGNFGANEYQSIYTFNHIPSATLNYNANTFFPGAGNGIKYIFTPNLAVVTPANVANKPSFWLKADGALNATRTFLNVPANRRTATSELNASWVAANSVLNATNAWIPNAAQGASATPTGNNQLGALTLDLGSVQTIHGVATLGAGANAFHVKDYVVRVSTDNVTYTDLGLFMGNELNTALRFADFDTPISCRYVRIIPSGFEGNRALRVDVYTKTPVAIANNSKVAVWEETSGNQWHAFQNNVAPQPTFNTNQINFNPAVNFTNNPGTSLNIPDLANIRQSYWVAQDATAEGNTYFHVLFGNETNLYGAATTPNFHGGTAGAVQFTATMSAAQGGWRKDGTLGSAASLYDFGPQGKPNLMTSFALQDNAPFSAQSISFQAGQARSWRGPIAEIITFQNQFSTNQQEIVETYLGIKYGITLGHDYITPNGTIVWNRTANTTYHNNVFGIGRSDSQGLHQRQSFSTNFTGKFITIGNNSVIGVTNAATVGNNLTTDNTYLIIGDDNANLLYSETLTGDYYPLLRKWRVSNTGITAATKISVPAFGNSAVNALPNSGFEKFDAETVYLVFDADGDGNFANATFSAMTKVGTGANATWEINRVLPNNAVIGFAVKQNLRDTDIDGVLDINDLDDDNDGILDSQEQVSCAPYGVNLENVTFNGVSVINKTINSITTNNNGWNSAYSTQNFSLPLSLKFNRNTTEGSFMFGLLPAAAAQTPTNWNDNGAKFYIAATQGYGYFNGVAWSFNHGAVTGNEEYSIDISATGYVTVKINGVQKQAYQGVNSAYKLAISASTTSALISNIRLTNAANPEKTICLDRDTDGDGIPNRLDLDSDGDGCSDAFEAGTTTNRTVDFAHPTTGVGTNGFSNSLEATPDNGIYNGTYNSLHVIDNNIKGCIDSDGDNSSDVIDLDDDNDGVLDDEECDAPSFSSWTDEARFKTKIMSSAFHGTLFRSKSGKYYVAGQYAKPDGNDQVTPTLVTPANGYNYTGEIIDMAAVGSNSCYVLATTDGIWVWGYLNTNFVLPGTTNTAGSPFQKVALPSEIDPKNIKSISASTNNFMILLQDGSVYTYAMTFPSLNGAGLTVATKGFTKVLVAPNTPLANIDQIEATSAGSFAADVANNKIYTWGDQVYLGNGSAASNRNFATEMTNPLPSGTGIAMIDATYNASMTYLVLGTDKKVYAMGSGSAGILGQNSVANSTTWVNVRGRNGIGILENIEYLSAQNSTDLYTSASVITNTGQPLSWGDAGGANMIGLGNTNALVPALPNGISETEFIYVIENGGHVTPMLNDKGEIGNVGHNVSGAFGDGSTQNRAVYIFNPFERGTDFSDNIAATCNPDIDKDGIINRLDLDTDGDGCSDAKEAGVSGTLISGTLVNRVNGSITNTTVTNAIAQGSYGANGLADGVETSANSGAINYVSTYVDFAKSATMNVCADSDNDGVPDILDIDDDNDGVLDATESPDCYLPATFFASGNRQASFTISSEIPRVSPNNQPKNLIDGDGTTIAIGFVNSSSIVNKELYKITFNYPVPLSQLTLRFADGNSHFNSGAIVKVQGSNDNTAWTDLNTGTTFNTLTDNTIVAPFWTAATSNEVFTITQNQARYKYYRLYGTAGSVNANGYATEFYFTTASSYEPSFYPKATCTATDTDGDGIANNLDLDSDGDGCPDAKEAGIIGTLAPAEIINLVNGTRTATPNVAGAVASGPYGANGFANGVETAAESAVYNGTFVYKYALSTKYNGCLDTDNDGVANLFDLDDDNDGILDAQECAPFDPNNVNYSPRSFAVTNGASASQTFPAAPNGLVVNVWTLDNSFNVRINGTYLTTPNELEYWSPANTNAIVEFLDGTSHPSIWTITGNQAQPIIRIYIDELGDVKLYGSRTTNGPLEEMRLRNGSFNNITLNTNAPNTFQIGQLVVAQTFITGDYGVINKNCDFDNDGIPNQLDLDSDGDGCSDAKEAGVSGTLNPGSIVNLTAGSTSTTTTTANVANTIANGPYGTNGFADALETSGNGNYTGVYTYYFAASSGLNACLDSDNDGVIDLSDIDDDNDGVLDAVESPTCFSTNQEASLPISLTSELLIHSTNSIINAIDNNATTYSAFSNGQNWVGKELFRITPSVVGPIAISGVQMELFNWALSGSPTSTFKLQGSLDNGTTWADLSAAVSSTASTGLFTVSNTLNPTVKYTLFRIVGVAGTCSYGGVYELRLVLPTTYQASLYPKSSCTNDTDGDTIPNYLDLDSDGDGCPDAREASVIGTLTTGTVINRPAGATTNTTTANVANAVAAGPYGLNGFANGLEVTSENGVYNGTYTYNFATNASINACIDTDNDGIGDIIDLDDDNDGILDATELVCTQQLTAKAGVLVTRPSTINYSFNGNTLANLVDGVDANTIVNHTPTGTLNNSPWLIFEFPTPRALSYLEIGHFSGQTLFATTSTYKIQGSTDNNNWTDVTGTLTYNNVATSTSGGLSTNNSNIASFPSNTTAYKFYRIFGIAATTGGGWATEVYFRENVCSWDLDNDGIINSLDLDSDGDGCPDAREAGVIGTLTTGTIINRTAGTSTNTTTAGVANAVAAGPYGLNGFANGLELTSENGIYNGTYTYNLATNANLNACIDTDSDGIGDIIDLDDDNDGVLDTEEFNCTPARMNKTGITVSSTVTWGFNGATTLANMVDNAEAIVAYSDSEFLNQTILQFNLPTARILSQIEIGNQAGNNPLGTTGTYRMQAWDGTEWIDLTANQTFGTPTAPINAANNSYKFNMPSNYTAYTRYRIFGTSNRGTVSGWIQEAYFTERICLLDIDGDGVPNHLDLDADGDGCADAIEAGSSTTATSTSNFPASAGNDTNRNGLLNNYEGGTAGTINYTSTYTSFALSNTINACTDTDGDGITDVRDLDDDNDGILDSIECPLTQLNTNESNGTFGTEATPRNTSNTNVTGGYVYSGTNSGAAQYAVINQGTPYHPAAEFWRYSGRTTGTATDAYLAVNGSTTVGTFYRESISLQAGARYRISFWHQAASANNDYQLAAEVLSASNAVIATANSGPQNSLGWKLASIDFTSATNQTVSFIIKNVSTNSSGNDFSIDDISITAIGCPDSDLDGTPNHLDLDSDGDGCSDALEGGATNVTTANYKFTSTAGTNGFADELETSPGSGVFSRTYSYNFALSNTINACTDSDNDGVRDILDLDDDNDGILDSVEMGCDQGVNITGTNGGVRAENTAPPGWTSSVSSPDIANAAGHVYGTWNVGCVGTAPLPPNGHLTWMSFFSNTQEAFKTTLNNLIPGRSYSLTVFYGRFAALGVGLGQVTVKLGTTVIDQYTPTVGCGWETRTITFTAAASSQELQFQNTGPTSATWNTNISISANAILPVCTDIDTDNDGISNRLDTDSDGDGCFDAVEAKTTYNAGSGIVSTAKLTTSTIPGTVGDNGFVNGLETAAGSGIYNGTYLYSRATDPNIKSCIDTDFDGLPDFEDVDDDNDGILDSNECVSALSQNFPTSGGNTNTLTGWTVGGTYAGSGSWTSATGRINLNTNGLEFRRDASTTSTITRTITNLPANSEITLGNLYWFNTNAADNSVVATLNVKLNGVTYATIKTGSANTALPSITVSNGATTNLSSLPSTSANTASAKSNVILKLPNPTIASASLIIEFIASSSAGEVDDIGFASISINSCDADTDGDGIPNSQDLDSDNDGCSDANEYYNSATAQGTDGNSYFGTGNPPAINANGSVTAASYSGTYTNAAVAGSASVITAQPVDAGVSPGATVSFTATVTAGSAPVAYQWKLSTDGGTTWANVTNTAPYSGATTTSLTVSNITMSMKGYSYKLVITQANYVCGTVVSNPAKIEIVPFVSIVDDAVTAAEDTVVSGNVLTNDKGSGNTALTVNRFKIGATTYNAGDTATIAGVGTIRVNSDGTFTFTPQLNYIGTVPAIEYTATDTVGASDSGTLSIVITPTNDPPGATDELVNVTEDIPFTGDVLSNDTDAEGNSLVVSTFSTTINNVIVTFNAGVSAAIPGVGTIVVNANGSFTFTPALNYIGIVPDVDYTISDGNGGSDTAKLSIVITPVNDAPLAADDIVTGSQGTTLTGSVRTNDSDLEGNNLTVTGFTVVGVAGTPVIGTPFSIPGVGSLTINPDGTYTFVPLSTFTGQAPLITYTLSDGNSTDTAVLDIYVAPVNQTPIARPDAKTINEDTTATGNVLSDGTPDSDPDANTVLKVTQYSFTIGSTVYTYPAGTTTSIPGVGVIVVNADGTYTFTPNSNYNGVVPVITYTITDDNNLAATGATVSSTLTITITPVNDNPITVNDDNKVTPEDTPISGNVLTNDSDPEGTAITVTQFTINGTNYPAGTSATITGVGTLIVNTNGSFTFTPAANYSGAVPTVTYTARDADGGTGTATLKLAVTPVNDAPVAVDDTVSTPENTAATGNVVTNDTDVEGNTKSVTSFTINGITYQVGTIVTIPNIGTLILNADGTYTFTPAPNTSGAVPVITYTLSDGNGGTDTADLNITVAAVNDAPVVVNESLSTNEDSPLTGNVLANDTDPENNTLTITRFTVAGQSYTAGLTATIDGVGTIRVNTDGTFTFTPVANYNGSVPVIGYTVSDGQSPALTTDGSLSINVNPVNDAPTARPDTASATINTAATGNVVDNDSDIEGSALTVTQFVLTINSVVTTFNAGDTATIPGVGTLVINADGTYTFTPATDYLGPVPVATYTVSDGTATATAALTLSITAPDTDGDGVYDFKETADGTDPNNFCDYKPTSVMGTRTGAWNLADCDGDGTRNGTDTAPLDPCIHAVNAQPDRTNALWQAADCDQDGETNGFEDANGTNYNNACSFTTAPTASSSVYSTWSLLDCDNDGLTNASEITGGTNPLNSDTDGDGNPDNTDTRKTTPTAINDTANGSVGVASVVNVLANDDYLPNDGNTITRVGGTATGTVSFNPVTGQMTYTPTNAEGGTAVTIIYEVCQGSVCATATVTITVAINDADGDGVSDNIEASDNTNPNDGCNYLPSSQISANTSLAWRAADCDGDGTPNGTDNQPLNPCVGGAAIPNTSNAIWQAADCDSDGIPNGTEGLIDTDGDGTPNYLDVDSDNDNIPDAVEKGSGNTLLDTDGDGTPDYRDLDSDNDGILDSIEDTGCSGTTPCTPTDTDGDNIPDYRDLDSDADGISDAIEKGPGSTPLDTDGDGTPDFQEIDSDGDGISDAIEKGSGATPIDTDSDGTPDYRDTDSDNDGISDAIEKGPGSTPIDTDGDNIPDYLDRDSDADGILDAIEKGPGATPIDTDGDNIPDFLDTDSDNDGISDAIEKGPGSGNTPLDTDADGIPDYRDTDSDNDGILDSVEKGSGSTVVDTDSDGTPDYRDLDSDGDGKPDAQEGNIDTDGDTIPNYQDLDSDDDGVLDAVDQCPLVAGTAASNGCPPDFDGDGLIDTVDLDDDNDGILDTVEAAACLPASPNCDTDGDGIPNRLDSDSDNDGISDVKEAGGTDSDNDGRVDGGVDADGVPTSANGGLTPPNTDGTGGTNPYDIDSDGDGIPDAIEKGANGNAPVDTDGDNIPDYLDLDSDGDGISDAIEKGPNGTTPIDTDGDGIADYKDLDSDNDGISDAIEKGPGTTPVDTDGDGTPDYRDTDSDNDGMSDTIEKGPTATPVDTDSDGTPDYRDLDSDNDGISDAIEKGPGTTPVDTDGDNIPDYRDLDSDGDGISDAIEKGPGATPVDTDGDGIPDYRDTDSDNDGISDANEKGSGATPVDTDGDGLPDYRDLDSDNDGIPDAVEKGPSTTPVDTDGDNIPDYRDLDTDNDGIPDNQEGVVDTDGDTIPDYRDLDSDGDGVLDTNDQCPLVVGTAQMNGCPADFDGDGIDDTADLDDDNDGILDSVEAAACSPTDPDCDTDGDGIPNRYDADSDNDGIKDTKEAGVVDANNDGKADGGVDANGVPSSTNGGTTPPNTDGDGQANPYDLDSDGDGISDSVEKGANGASPVDTDGDGAPDYLDLDSDNDGIPDAIEKGTGSSILDSDGDGTPDYRDLDSDNDGILDSVEKGTTATPIDTDGDNIPDYRDLDSDNDGMPDAVEKGSGSTPVDTDGDGTPDYRDTDSDNDGITDAIEKGPNGVTPIDTDGDGTPDYRDLDSDNDGIPDATEKGTGSTPLDTDNDGTPDYRELDSDNDGISDSVEKGTGTIPLDTDNDQIPDYRDIDSDNDGIPDAVEKGSGSTPVDTDGDGTPDYLNTDSDNDGIPDSVEKGPNGANPIDTDNDGTPDYRDLDSDNDGISDAIEKGPNGATPVDTDSDNIPDYRDADSDVDNKPDNQEGLTDTDGDGVPNYRDTDSDNDGVLDVNDQCPYVAGTAILNGCPPDSDSDGITDDIDLDDDNDGILDTVENGICSPASVDCDTDGDGIPNRLDPDSDNDGISDARESNGTDTNGDGKVDGNVDANGIPQSSNGGVTPPNTDGDANPNPYDLDSDGDGITDAIEKGTNGNAPVDSDGDGTQDYLDLDSDNDGIPDTIEKGTGTSILDTDGDGTPDYRDVDSDNDGIPDAVEKGPNGATPVDTDGDGILDYRDLDSDNDSIPDAVEKGPNGNNPVDTDGDGTPDYRDVDSDGDGVGDFEDDCPLTIGSVVLKGCPGIDSDNDGIPDAVDLDDDNDGITDVVENAACTPTASNCDTDGDGIINSLDLDSDNDGITDARESNGIDANGDGRIDGSVNANGVPVAANGGTTPPDTDGDGRRNPYDVDSDNDGISDSVEKGANSNAPVDTDGDGTPDYLDLDSDNDGISDAIEKGPSATPVDTDGDGTLDYRDLDSDNDGISDAIEKGPSATPVDTDGDGTLDYRDLDSDNDGISDAIEKGPTATPVDTDNDGTPDYRDLDSDNDGISDAIEKGPTATPVDTDNDGTPDYRDLDSDNDGISDAIEKGPSATPVDTDNDGTPDYRDLDSDGDGIPDSVEDSGCTGTAPCTPTDTDGDGVPNYLDLDSDGDGIPDTIEKGPNGATPVDTDGDGTPDYLDTDSDSDGIPDSVEKGPNGASPVDTDGNGTPDYQDLDSDNDGIPDAVEKGPNGATPVDTDNDGIPDYRDLDSDNDGIPDAVEKGPNGATSVDTDNDGIPDYRDLDSDNDGIPDSVEKGPNGATPVDTDGDGTPDYLDLDSDNDGIPDAVEKGPNGAIPIDTNGDGTPDYLDLDSDNDGIPDAVEKGPNGSTPVDTDGDGTPDYLDTDSDGDGIPDSVEDSGCTGTAPYTPTDTDGDGTPNYLDADSDGDGIPDTIEKGPNGATPVDTDGDGTPDYKDLDSDNDGILDSVEKGPNGATPVDTDGDGTPDYLDLDSDGDGIPDAVEKGPNGATPIDTDGDGTPDYRDLDSDNDGIPDAVEKGPNGATPIDTDGDGTPDYLDLDSDNDGIPDAVEKGLNGATPVDTDNDGTPDYLDLDSDNDSIPDADEKGPDGTNPIDTDGDGVPDYRDLPNVNLNPDTDGDGVTDSQELIDGTDPTDPCSSNPQSITVPLSQLFLDGDCDGDGLSNGEELGLNPMLPTDVDNNGTPDYLEFNNHSQSEDDLEIFNSMTTNGDGLNDVFVIRGIENYPDNNLYIYNRWGVEVYNVEGYGQDDKYFRGLSEGRNTISQSAELPKGTYYFILRYKNKQGVDKQRSGYLYITK
ncbi:hypothetical protein SHINM13_06540 [Flavobacterium ammonificans]|nr:hypothetical protein SHINM13_06540 [Flavobacterium ammonificans]